MLKFIKKLSIACPFFFLTGCSAIIPDMLKIVSDTVEMEAHKHDGVQDIEIHISVDEEHDSHTKKE